MSAYAAAFSNSGWLFPEQATGSPNSGCASGAGSAQTLIVSGFGFALPATAIVDSIQVRPKTRGADTANTIGLRLVRDGGVVGNSKSVGIQTSSGGWACTDTVFADSSADLWGTTWTAAQVNSGTFGVRMTAHSSGNGMGVDAVQIVVNYTPLVDLNLGFTGDGSGAVNLDPPDTDCSSPCTESYAVGTGVTLTQTPAPGSVASGFGGDPDCADGQVTLNATLSCTAIFRGPTIFVDGFEMGDYCDWSRHAPDGGECILIR
ncbi:MAG: hypothetical protein R2862_10130 [Thermoanaerobaculia bacterium]